MERRSKQRKSRFRGEKKMKLEKKEIQLKTRMTVSQQEIIIIEGKRMRQLQKLQEDVEKYL